MDRVSRRVLHNAQINRSSSRQQLAWLPAAVLVAGIVAQVSLMATVAADPQSGSGFAMFSTVETASIRSLNATGVFDGESVRLVIPANLRRQADLVQREPTDDRAVELATDLRSLTWDSAGTARESGKQPSTVSVTVWGISASGRTLSSLRIVDVVSP